jgi:hypothetical protein
LTAGSGSIEIIMKNLQAEPDLQIGCQYGETTEAKFLPLSQFNFLSASSVRPHILRFYRKHNDFTHESDMAQYATYKMSRTSMSACSTTS